VNGPKNDLSPAMADDNVGTFLLDLGVFYNIN